MVASTSLLILTVPLISLSHPHSAHAHYSSLRRHYRLLDADANGVVSFEEAAEGYTTVGSTPREWRHSSVSSRDRWLSLAQFSCGKRWSTREEIDPAGFVDCIAFRSRAMLLADASPPSSSSLPFQRAFSWWLTDVKLGANTTNYINSAPWELSLDLHGLAPRLSTSGVNSALILISSDWHIEPWYAGDALSSPQSWYTDGVVRFLDAGLTNMMSCADGATGTHSLPCNLTGKSDPPIEHIITHFDAFARLRRNASAAPDSFFFAGDTQAHKMNWTIRGKPEYGNFSHDYRFVPAISTLMKAVFAGVIPRFGAEHVYWATGNHDGPEDRTFASATDEGVVSASLAWGNALVESGIVTNQLSRRYNGTGTSGEKQLDQVQFFLQTGYYMKRFAALPDANLFVICTNTNLGASNMRQNRAFFADLAWIAARGGAVYLIGHHPQTIGCLNERGIHACGYDHWIPAQYRPLIRGIFAGHIHRHAPTNMTNYFTQVGSIDQAGDDTFYIANITSAADYHVVLDPTRGDLVAYTRAPGMPNESLWHRSPIAPPTPNTDPTPHTGVNCTKSPLCQSGECCWQCHPGLDSITFERGSANDTDWTSNVADLWSCIALCARIHTCARVNWYPRDHRCHTLSGGYAHAEYEAGSTKVTHTDDQPMTCVLTKPTPTP